MTEHGLILITGGCRSGKSEYAEKLAENAKGKVFYLATAIVSDQELAVRVSKHRNRRPLSWTTLEEPLEIENLLQGNYEQGDVLLIDSLSGWLTNLMYEDGFENWQWNDDKEKALLGRVEHFAEIAKRSEAKIIVVADEVGCGVVPPYPEGRAFRDINGQANQIVAKAADRVYFVVTGIPMNIK